MSMHQDSDGNWVLDLGAMSDAKEDIVRSAMAGEKHDCAHPLTSHTGTEATWPWKVCAHVPCPCRILAD